MYSKNRSFFIEFTGTPEAGKTTQMHIISSKLKEEGFSVELIQESAEVSPNHFLKNSIEANHWMFFHTLENITSAIEKKADILIADRGAIDKLVWEKLYFLDNKISLSQYLSVKTLIYQLDFIPDLLINFQVMPSISIIRRGGEGRIVTKSFVSLFNNTLNDFLQSDYENIYYQIDGSLKINQISSILMDKIHSML